MDAERCPVVLEPTPHSYEVACSRCGQTGQVVVSVVERLAAPTVTETDPIDAYLASPEAVEQLARALHRVQNPDGGQCSDLLGKHGFSAAAILTALRKVRADD